VGLLGACASGAAITTIRALRREGVGAWEIFTFFCAVGLLCTAPQTALRMVRPTPPEWGMLVAVGLLGLAAQLVMNHALGSVTAAAAGIINQLTPVTTLVLGAWFLGEPLNALAGLGALVTLTGVGWATWLGERRG
jgi:drug/metabolite transporter (DMT)-like permease